MATSLEGLSKEALQAIIKETDPAVLARWAEEDPILKRALTGTGSDQVGFRPEPPTTGTSSLGTGSGGGWGWPKRVKTPRKHATSSRIPLE